MLITILHDLMQLCYLTRFREDIEMPKNSNPIKKRREIKAISRGRVEEAIRYRPKPKLFLPKNEFNEKMGRMKSSRSNRWKY